jgi:hypothetical protein
VHNITPGKKKGTGTVLDSLFLALTAIVMGTLLVSLYLSLAAVQISNCCISPVLM